jgi:DNA mismatch repair protein MutS2
MEATYQVDQYLDEATLGGLENVTIIHGVGTGVLKEKLWDMFRHHPHVKSYRLGEYGEGGQGVTIVTIK